MAAPQGILSRIGSLFSRRGYEAAALAPRFRDTDGRWGEWQTIGGNAVPASLVLRAEHAWRNGGYFRNACESLTAAHAGSGFGIAPKDSDIMSAWTAFAANAQWDGGSFDGLTVAMVRAMVVSGEGLAVEQPDGRWHQLPHSAIAGDYSAELSDSRIVREGVELTNGRETGIYIRRDQDTAMERLDRSLYVRLWRKDFPDQVRGVPWGASVLIAADVLADTEQALLAGVKTSALLSVLMVNENDMGAAFPFEGDQRGSVMDSGLEPGALKIVPGGYRPHVVAPQQSQQAKDFLTHQLHKIAAGFGVPTHLVSNDLSNANYSSLRAGMVEFNVRVEAAQYGIIVPLFLKPVWERFVSRLYLAGTISDLEAAKECEFIAPARPWIDPAKDAAATAELLRLRLISPRRAVAALGWDFETILKETSEDQSRATALGLNTSAENPNA